MKIFETCCKIGGKCCKAAIYRNVPAHSPKCVRALSRGGAVRFRRNALVAIGRKVAEKFFIGR